MRESLGEADGKLCEGGEEEKLSKYAVRMISFSLNCYGQLRQEESDEALKARGSEMVSTIRNGLR